MGIQGLGSRIRWDSRSWRAGWTLRLARSGNGNWREPRLLRLAEPGLGWAPGRGWGGAGGRGGDGLPFTLPRPEPPPPPPPLGCTSRPCGAVVGRSPSSPWGGTLGTRRASSATAAESQGPPPTPRKCHPKPVTSTNARTREGRLVKRSLRLSRSCPLSKLQFDLLSGTEAFFPSVVKSSSLDRERFRAFSFTVTT